MMRKINEGKNIFNHLDWIFSQINNKRREVFLVILSIRSFSRALCIVLSFASEFLLYPYIYRHKWLVLINFYSVKIVQKCVKTWNEPSGLFFRRCKDTEGESLYSPFFSSNFLLFYLYPPPFCSLHSFFFIE